MERGQSFYLAVKLSRRKFLPAESEKEGLLMLTEMGPVFTRDVVKMYA